MKAIYINIDPYLAAFAAWLKGGKSGPAPSFNPLPLAVTIPLGAEACIFVPLDSADHPGHPIQNEDDYSAPTATVDGQSVRISLKNDPEFSDIIQSAISLPFSSVVTSGLFYAAVKIDSSAVDAGITLYGETDDDYTTIPFTVFVRRETASGQVDLVDFTPPAAAPTAAQINAALGGSGATEGAPLNGVSIKDVKVFISQDDIGLTDIQSAEYTAGGGYVVGSFE